MKRLVKKKLLLCGSAFVLTALVAATASAAVLKPTPVHFPNTFGSMTFPATFPDGTAITITQWSHFVPSYNPWFDSFAKEWGKKNNVKVTVNHISYADLIPTLTASMAAGSGPTLLELISPPAAFVEGLQDLTDVNKAAEAAFGKQLDVCKSQTYLPSKNMYYGFCHGWAPDPGDYRISLWKEAGYPEGPKTYADLLEGGTKIFKKTGIEVGVGISPDIDSEFFDRSLIWSFGGKVFDKCGDVALDSPQVVDAVKYQVKLFKNAQTPAVLSWNAASNNQAFVSGQASYIQNSISFFRSAQHSNPKVAKDTGFSPGLKGPTGQVHQTSHLYITYVLPKYVKDAQKVLAAKKFLLDYTANYSWVTEKSGLYNFPAFPKLVPQLWAKGGWLDYAPDMTPHTKLQVLKDATKWTAWPGYPGFSNPAVSEVFNTHLITTMMSDAVRGTKTPEQAVKDTAAQIAKIVQKWKDKGDVGCQATSD